MPHTEVLLETVAPNPLCPAYLSGTTLPTGPIINLQVSNWSVAQLCHFPLAGRVREDSASLCRCLGSSRGPAEWEGGDTAEEKTGLQGLKAGWKTEGDPSGRGKKREGSQREEQPPRSCWEPGTKGAGAGRVTSSRSRQCTRCGGEVVGK